MIDPVSSAPYAANVMLHLVLLGVAAALIVPDRRSATTRALAASFALWGSQIVAPIWARSLQLGPLSPVMMEIGTIGGALSGVALAEWLVRIVRTASQPGRVGDISIALLRISQLVTLATPVLIVMLHELYMVDYVHRPHGMQSVGFWLFKSLELASLLTLAAPVLVFSIAGIDLPERRMVMAAMIAAPFFLMSGFLPNGLPVVLSFLLGVLVFLVGITSYHVAQGRRAAFLSRFLSPKVRDGVLEHGLARTIRPGQMEISVVCCDLRGFTAYSASRDSGRVMALLRAYYDLVGRCCGEQGATIKDFAGDGVLVLVGAPEPMPDHAVRALELAKSLRAASSDWLRSLDDPGGLGFGIGVASGRVTVGVIESTSRLEYAAVGEAVNLAARLCAQAGHGEVLVADGSRELARQYALEARPALECKGFAEPVTNYALV